MDSHHSALTGASFPICCTEPYKELKRGGELCCRLLLPPAPVVLNPIRNWNNSSNEEISSDVPSSKCCTEPYKELKRVLLRWFYNVFLAEGCTEPYKELKQNVLDRSLAAFATVVLNPIRNWNSCTAGKCLSWATSIAVVLNPIRNWNSRDCGF